MNKQRLLTIAVLGLLLLNMTMVGVFIFRKPPHQSPLLKAANQLPQQGHKELKETVIETLKFDDDQIEKYEELIQQHRDAICQKDSLMLDLKSKLYATLADNNVAAKDAANAAIAALHNEIEMIHYNHFEAIKAICKPEQLQAFNQLSKEFAMAFKQQHKPGHPPMHRPPPHPED